MIRILPPHIANKIAAGEVIERPFSVVKELVENSLDAEADRIIVEIEEGGKRLIRVTDNGRGMPEDELPLALHPHATSKIRDADDLFQVMSFGFRGEALASIGSVARVSIVSRTKAEEMGHKIECAQSQATEVIQVGAPVGTTVEVHDLFINTPARRKFLKSDGAEVSRTSEILTRIALARPDIHLEFTHNGRRVLRCERVTTHEERIVRLFGKELKGNLLAVEGEASGIRLHGFVGTPGVAKAASNRQYLFLNDRMIKDKSLNHAVTLGFEGFLMSRRYPVYFLFLEVDPKTVDVNVHPTKAEVRFRERNAVFSVVKKAIHKALAQDMPMGELSMSVEAPKSLVAPPPEVKQTPAERVKAIEHQLFPDMVRDVAPRPIEPQHEPRVASVAPTQDTSTAEIPLRYMQVHSSYIVVEDDDGFYVMDQHALHERMLFERIWQRVESGERASQRLLVPEVFDVSPSEAERFHSIQAELEALGFAIEPFGGASFAVTEVPIELAKSAPAKLIETVLSSSEGSEGRSFRELRRDVVASMACRAAVKFNQRLSDAQIRELILWERTSEDSAACPHGRPTRMRVTMKDLERQFLRKE